VIVGAPLVMIGLVLSTLRKGEAVATPPVVEPAVEIVPEDCGPEAVVA
jgi:hypothetical protein